MFWYYCNWVNNPTVRSLKITFDPTQAGISQMIVTHVILANHKTESCVYRWLRAHATFNVMCFPPMTPTYLIFSKYWGLFQAFDFLYTISPVANSTFSLRIFKNEHTLTNTICCAKNKIAVCTTMLCFEYSTFGSNINWRDVQTKNVVNNADMSS